MLYKCTMQEKHFKDPSNDHRRIRQDRVQDKEFQGIYESLHDC